MSLQAFIEFLKNRRSIRQYSNKAVSHKQLTRILDAAKWAPSAHNAQPWRFFILQTPAEKEKLAKAMGELFRQDLEADNEDPELIEDLVKGSFDRFSTAPVLILACLTMTPMDSYPDEPRQQAELLMGVQSVAAAIAMILLAAHSEGLGACWFCAPLFCPERIRQVLELDDEYLPQALITLGTPGESPDPPVRKPFEAYVTFIDQ